MVRLKLKGVAKAKKDLERSKKKLVQKLYKKIHLATMYTHTQITSMTAVWSGKTMVNWRWTTNSPSKSIEGIKGGKGGYGQTSQMSLESEPQHRPNRAVADASFKALKIDKNNPFEVYIMSNPWFVAKLQEEGRAPTLATARTKGMMRLTKQGLLDYMRNVR